MGKVACVGQRVRQWHRSLWADRFRWLLPLILLCTACSSENPFAPPPQPSPTAATPAANAVTGVPPVEGGISEGVRVTGADIWQAAGITGKGVKVGIIDM